MQWTITKFTIILMNSQKTDDIELLVELEDIIMSVDKQNAYTKFKAKFGSINGIRKKHNQSSGELDVLNIISRSDTLAAEAQETFFEMVATTAIASNVHSRWGTTSKKVMGFRNEIDTITEIMITMQSIDLKLELDVLSVILAIRNESQQNNAMEYENDCNQSVSGTEHVYCVKDLPLIFFECKGLQLWLPIINNKNLVEPDVLIVKVNEKEVESV